MKLSPRVLKVPSKSKLDIIDGFQQKKESSIRGTHVHYIEYLLTYTKNMKAQTNHFLTPPIFWRIVLSFAKRSVSMRKLMSLAILLAMLFQLILFRLNKKSRPIGTVRAEQRIVVTFAKQVPMLTQCG